MNTSLNPTITNIDFTAVYSEDKVRANNRFKFLCLSNPVGWVVGSLYLINELFKSIILYCGRPILFGGQTTLQERSQALLKRLNDLSGQELKLQSPDGRLLEAMHIKASNNGIDQQKTILLFTGSHRSYEFYACPIVEAYQSKGYHVLCINYAGFGQSESSPNESNMELDAETAYQYIQKIYSNNEIYAHGYSLGSYSATYLAKTYHLKKVVIDRGFSRLSDVVKDHAAQMFGYIIAIFLKTLVSYVGALNNLENIKNSSSDLMIARASNDTTMQKYHGEELSRVKPSAKIFDFQGIHLHNNHVPIWFHDHQEFWDHLEKPLIPSA